MFKNIRKSEREKRENIEVRKSVDILKKMSQEIPSKSGSIC